MLSEAPMILPSIPAEQDIQIIPPTRSIRRKPQVGFQ